MTRVRDVVEEPLDVRVEHDLVSLAVEFQDPLDCLMAVSSLDKSERGVVKLRFEDRCQKPTNHFLGHAIPNHGNSERPELRRSGTFGNVDTT